MAQAESEHGRTSSPALLVVKTIEGRRSSATNPIPAAERKRQLAKLARNGVIFPKPQTP